MLMNKFYHIAAKKPITEDVRSWCKSNERCLLWISYALFGIILLILQKPADFLFQHLA
jgi:hypothetical protein